MSAGVEAYASSLEHLLAELERLDLLLRVQVWRARQRHGDAAEEELAAFYVPDAEADALLNKAIGTPTWATVPLPSELREPLQARLDQLAAEHDRRTAESLRRGVPLRLVELARLFDLTDFDADVVLACLAPELDRRYERLYAYLHDDVTRRQPTVELVLNLLCPDLDTKVAARTRFTPVAPLFRHHLVQLGDEPDQRRVSLLGKTLRLDPRVARFLLDDDAVDDRLQPHARVVIGAGSRDELVFPEAFTRQLSQLVDYARTDGANLVLYCQGHYGVGKRTAAAACCQALGGALLVVDGTRLAASNVEEFATLAHVVDREARLQGALLYWEDFDLLLADEKQAHLATLLPVLEAHPGPSFLSSATTWEPVDALRGVTFVRLVFPQPGHQERLHLWRAALAEDATVTLDPAVDPAALANKFRLSGGQIRDAAATARNLALARTPAAPLVTQADLHAACRLHSNRRLAELAQKIAPHYTWYDIVLPADQMAQLREIYNQVQHRALVYETWGFDAKLAMGKGLSILFAGPPGTGKTMAADVLAGALGLDLYKIDLSTVVSKYIGETEKNLARIFDEARTSNAILFFDEADALFGKRTQVRDAHDRYANVEISYLLQKMEEYDGVVILATNLRKNLDEAFVRRLHVIVEFPLPDVADRRRIWEQIWPAATPRDPDLDLEFLARRVEVAGGSIRNIALAGAFLAATDGGVVTMQHLLRATHREYQKIGKVLTGGEFGEDAGRVMEGEPS
jgi:ATPase family associated with various cellular activities (AAA)